jgi:hypothetical protein
MCLPLTRAVVDAVPTDQKKDCRWRAFFESRWGAPNATVEKAAKLAGSWRQLYAAKQVVEQESQPWVKPTSFEVAAAVEGIAVRALGLPESDGAVKDAPVETDVTSRSVLFLVDGSGSVTEGVSRHPLTDYIAHLSYQGV